MEHTRLRILRVGPKNYPPNHGGVEKNAFLLVKLMPWAENHIFTEWQPEIQDPRVHELPKGIFAQARSLHGYARRNHIDIVHLHKETFIPLGLLLRFLGHRCVVTIHGCVWRLRRWPFHIRILFFAFDLVACCLMNRTVFVGEHDYTLFQRLIPFRRLRLIRNGIEVRPAQNGSKQDGLICLGRLSPEKNTISLIKAADAARVSLDLYGPLDRHDRSFRKLVEDMLQRSQYVKWRGQIKQEEVPEVLAKYRVVINASLSEGLPTSVLEAAAQGLFLILSDIPPHRVLRLPGCVYVDPCALQLENLLPDSQAIGRLGAENQKHVTEHFDVRTTIHAYDELYRELL